jgi:hypothetical protein
MRPPALQIDPVTTNIVINKEKELMQSSNRIDYYFDGLGTRAQLNSDDLHEKQARFEATGKIDEEMVCFYLFVFLSNFEVNVNKFEF